MSQCFIHQNLYLHSQLKLGGYKVHKLILGTIILLAFSMLFCTAQAQVDPEPTEATDDLNITLTRVNYNKDLDALVFIMRVEGKAGGTTPTERGDLDGAPVLGYVFPTTLSSSDVGFGEVEGIVALALTSHPDFDDTPLWDENNNGTYDDDGLVYHSHWVILAPDERVAGGLSVKEFSEDDDVTLPPTNPGMPMYLDSPGFGVSLCDDDENALRVIVPANRVNNNTDFSYDGVTAYMQVNTSDEQRPLLGVYSVYSVSSGDLSLPYTVHKP